MLNLNIYRGSHISLGWFSCGSSILVELEFGDVVFAEGRKPENPGKNPMSKTRTNNKLMTTRIWHHPGVEPRPHFMRGECSHHCAIPAPHVLNGVQ